MQPRMSLPAALGSFAILAGAASAQELVRDIELGPPAFDLSAVAEIARVGDRVYFSGNDPEHGFEPRVLELGAASSNLLLDLVPGDAGSTPADFFPLPDGRVIFTASTPELGREPWVTDGTTAGTQLLADLNPGMGASSPRSFTRFAEFVLFFAFQPDTGYELWRTDGTTAGTNLVAEVFPGPEGIDFLTIFEFAMAAHETGVVFTPYNSVTGEVTVWASDSTTDGTFQVGVLPPSNDAYVHEMVATPQAAFFRAPNGVGGGGALWRSDGTIDGTGAVAHFDAGTTGDPANFFALGEQVFFSAFRISVGNELWVHHAVTGTTRLVIDLLPGGGFFGGSSNPVPIGEFNGELVFAGQHPQFGYEYLLTDGTPAGTRVIADIVPGPEQGGAQAASGPDLAVLGGEMVLRAFTPEGGVELWRSDGTESGTALIEDLEPGTISSQPVDLVAFGDRVVFEATTTGVGNELFSTDLAAAGPLEDLFPSFDSGDSNPRDFVRVGDLALFVATDQAHGSELWRTDGTEAGTQLVKDILPGPDGAVVSQLEVLGSKVIFLANTPEFGFEPWVSDGTPEGTQLLIDLVPGPMGNAFVLQEIVEFGGRAYFRTFNEQGFLLLASDGTPSGTAPFFPAGSPHLDAVPLVATGGYLYLRSSTPETGIELFRVTSDPATVALVADLWPGPESSLPGNFGAGRLDNRIVFSANNGLLGSEPWISDGTDGGTQLLADLVPGPDSSSPSTFREVDAGLAFFVIAQDGTRQVAVTSGTSSSTLLLTSGNSASGAIGSSGGVATFFRDSLTGGFELWRTNGTPGGTGLIKAFETDDFATAFAGPFAPAGSGTLRAFRGDEVATGQELWLTDGTIGGTQLWSDFQPGQVSSFPDEFFRLGNQLLFSAKDGQVGRELFRVPIVDLGAYVAEPYGEACPGGDQLSIEGTPLAGQTFELQVNSPLAGTFGAVGVALSSGFVDLPSGCQVFPVGQVFVQPFLTNGFGEFALQTSLDAALTGIPFQLQAFLLDGAEVRLTNALELIVGN